MSKSISIEDIASFMDELVKEGKITGWRLSQATESEIRRADAITPLTAIQREYSIMERMFEKDFIPACKESALVLFHFLHWQVVFCQGK